MSVSRNIVRALALLCIASLSAADDTSLFKVSTGNSRPQVLIILDTSSSMGATVQMSPVYVPQTSRSGEPLPPAAGSKLYFTRADEQLNVNNLQAASYILHANNACADSWEQLQKYGVYTGFIGSFDPQLRQWSDTPASGGSVLVDCLADIESGNYQNGSGRVEGLPVAGDSEAYIRVNANSSQAHRDAAKASARASGLRRGVTVTLYSEHYINWKFDNTIPVYGTRMELAKEALRQVALSMVDIDLGLAIFNVNLGDREEPGGPYGHGGKIVSAINRFDSARRMTFLGEVERMGYAFQTPTCETLYEAYRYFAGEPVLYGNQDRDYYWDYGAAYKGMSGDPAAEVQGVYQSPFKGCDRRGYIIYITDGEPTEDFDANDAIRSLTGVGYSNSDDNDWGKMQNAREALVSLAGWMNTHDVTPGVDGEQMVSTHTIGYSEGALGAKTLLESVATVGGGSFFDATDLSSQSNFQDKLQQALKAALNQIVERESSFSSPAVVNSETRLETGEHVYLPMFRSAQRPRWSGDIKKYRLSGDGRVLDKNGMSVTAADGGVAAEACSVWAGSCNGGDGQNFGRGGVAAAVAAMADKDRVLYTQDGAKLAPLTLDSLTAIANGGGELASELGLPEALLGNHVSWIRGVDVDDADRDGDRTESRSDSFGDMLHARPVALEYGSGSNKAVYLLAATNQGFLHMFKDSGTSVSELWAFMPWSLLSNQYPLRTAVSGGHNIYGLDSTPVVRRENGPDGQKTWVFFGMRRGGKQYFALDISNPANPTMLWQAGPESEGLEGLGQTWARPVVTQIPGHKGPVLIVGGGYQPGAKDSAQVGSGDSMGLGVYILNATDGNLIHSFSADVVRENQTLMPGLKDSIPNEVAVLDANGDGLTDRIYATDTGGNVWRLDLPGPKPDKTGAAWSAFKFASLGGSSAASDRRFFSAPVIAQTATDLSFTLELDTSTGTETRVSRRQLPYDAVAIGSGIRPLPMDTSREDAFFLLQDRITASQSFNKMLGGDEPPEPLTTEDLFDVSERPITEQDEIAFAQTRGWVYGLGLPGEKSLSSATIVRGRVFFTTFAPEAGDENLCQAKGRSFLYGMDLHRGFSFFTRQRLEMGSHLADTPQLVIPDGERMYFIGVGNADYDMKKAPCPANDPNCDPCKDGGPRCIGGGLETHKIYYYSK